MTGKRKLPEGLMSVREYAAHLGVSHPAVLKAMRSGRLKQGVVQVGGGKTAIDPNLADREWHGNGDDSMQRNGGAGGRAPAGGASSLTAGFQGKSLSEWRATQVALQARHEQLDLEERLGKVVAVDAVRAEWFAVCRTIREKLLFIPERLAGRLTGEMSQTAIRQAIDGEIRDVLQELSHEFEPARTRGE